jgi:hypothetical protein
MAGFIERRKYERIPRTTGLLANLLFRKQDIEVSHDIPVTTVNVSRSGMMIHWPRGWVCPDCRQCRFWIFNKSCRLKSTNDGNGDFTKPLPLRCLLQFRSQHPRVNRVKAEVIWLAWNPGIAAYNVGLRFLEELPALPF